MKMPSSGETIVTDGKARILVAEDDAVNCHNTLWHLAALGFEADVALDGEAAVQGWASSHYDIIFMDCQMPKMDGHAATQEIRRRENGGSRTVIIALTTLDSPSDRQNCLSSGMDDFLSKPIVAARLVRCLNNWLKEPFKGTKTGEVANAKFANIAELDFTAQLIPIFLLDAPNRISSMQKALAESDSHTLERAAHTLKSSSGLLGAQSLSRQCEILESRVHNGAWQDVEQVLHQLEDEFIVARRLLESKISLGENPPGTR